MWQSRVCIVLVCASLLSLGALGSPAQLIAQGSGSGKAILFFTGLEARATLSGDLALSGQWRDGRQTISFTAQGTILGSGVWRLTTLSGEAWVTFLAQGTAAQTEPIEVRGAIAVGSGGAQWRALGVVDFTGRFVLVLRRASGDLAWLGTVSGELRGGFVVPDLPFTMQAEGSATLAFSGEPCASPLAGLDPEVISASAWGASAWPDEVSRELLTALGWVPPPALAGKAGG